MNEKEIRAKYEAQVCETQMEFDRIMSEMNTEQTHLNHPYLDRERELARQKELLEQQKQGINIQLNAIKLERLDLEQKRKDITECSTTSSTTLSCLIHANTLPKMLLNER